MELFFQKKVCFQRKKWKNMKKNRKNFSIDLKKILICCILFELLTGLCVYGTEKGTVKSYSGKENELAEIRKLKAEIALLQEEKKVIRKELLETLDKNTMLAGKLKKLELSIASVTESLSPVYTGDREEELVESLRTVMQSSVALASASGSLCAELEKMLADKVISDPVSAAKLRILINSASMAIRKIAVLSIPAVPPRGFESCRILNIDFSLNAVCVSAGYRNGVRHGMLLYSPDGKNTVRITAVKNFVSAGIVNGGDIRKLGIGMELKVRKATGK